MHSNLPPIVVFEHQALRVGGNVSSFSEPQLKALQRFHGEKGCPFFSLIDKGIKFCEFVGVIQIGNLTIEVLPKADKNGDKAYWRSMLIGMLRASGILNVTAPSESSLKLKPNALLDIYIELFISELEYLLHRGLAMKYRRTEGNSTSFKGSILFSKHIQQNIVHQERMYTRSTIFDREHLLHKVLYKALCLLTSINTKPDFQSRIGSLLLLFPEMQDIRVDEKTFDRIVLNRGTQHYEKAVSIARLLLLNYHPDVVQGRNNVLALMFDMNFVWERFVYKSLSRNLPASIPGIRVQPQNICKFWKPTDGYVRTIRPDISISFDNKNFIIDTKWKSLDSKKVSAGDLQQLYAYHHMFSSNKVAILHPGTNQRLTGHYLGPLSGEKECSLIPIEVHQDIRIWQENIAHSIKEWMSSE